MDIQLPGMSGIEAIGVLRANPATAAIPVVAVTASVMPQDRNKITEAGFDAYIGKPINLKEFLDGVRDDAGEIAQMRRPSMSTPAKVLVVDDTPNNVKLLADILAAKGLCGDHGRVGRGSAGEASPRNSRTWCCST